MRVGLGFVEEFTQQPEFLIQTVFDLDLVVTLVRDLRDVVDVTVCSKKCSSAADIRR